MSKLISENARFLSGKNFCIKRGDSPAIFGNGTSSPCVLCGVLGSTIEKGC